MYSIPIYFTCSFLVHLIDNMNGILGCKWKDMATYVSVQECLVFGAMVFFLYVMITINWLLILTGTTVEDTTSVIKSILTKSVLQRKL